MGDEVYAVVMKKAADGWWQVVQPPSGADDLNDFAFDPEAHYDADASNCISDT